ncbi:hypothetical protein Tco_0546510 [Tanacetum coccineum]
MMQYFLGQWNDSNIDTLVSSDWNAFIVSLLVFGINIVQKQDLWVRKLVKICPKCARLERDRRDLPYVYIIKSLRDVLHMLEIHSEVNYPCHDPRSKESIIGEIGTRSGVEEFQLDNPPGWLARLPSSSAVDICVKSVPLKTNDMVFQQVHQNSSCTSMSKFQSASQAGGTVVGSQAPAATVSQMRRTKKSSSRLTPTK